jgi:hypothetical protein
MSVAAARSVAPDGLKTKQREVNAANEFTSLMRARSPYKNREPKIFRWFGMAKLARAISEALKRSETAMKATSLLKSEIVWLTIDWKHEHEVQVLEPCHESSTVHG